MDMNDNVISKADLWAERIHAFQESGLSRKDWLSIPGDFTPRFRKMETGIPE